MVLTIDYHDREVNFTLLSADERFDGSGIPELLALIEKYGTMISRVEVEGSSPSYTFTRQVYLVVNVLKFIKEDKKLEFPKYSKTIK